MAAAPSTSENESFDEPERDEAPGDGIDSSVYDEWAWLFVLLGCPSRKPSEWHGPDRWSWLSGPKEGALAFDDEQLPIKTSATGMGHGSVNALRSVEFHETATLVAIMRNYPGPSRITAQLCHSAEAADTLIAEGLADWKRNGLQVMPIYTGWDE